LIDVLITDGTQDLIIAKRQGRTARFHESAARAMGRDAAGVRATRLEEDDAVVGVVAVKREGTLLVVTENGFGKRTPISDYPVKGRGAMGVLTIRNTPRNGPVMAIKEVIDSDELMMVTSKGVVIRLPLASVRVQGRTTQGVRLIRLDEGDRVTDVARIVAEEGVKTDVPALAVVPPSAEGGEEPEDLEDDEGDDAEE